MRTTIGSKTLEDKLKELASVCPHILVGRINPNEIIPRYELPEAPKNRVCCYRIDSIPELQLLSLESYEFVPYTAIAKHFTADELKLSHLFVGIQGKGEKNIILPFSRVWKKRAGGSFEKAIALQLAVQANFESYLVNGIFRPSEDAEYCSLTFNLLFYQDMLYIVDIQNPFFVVGPRMVPFVMPVMDINKGGIRLPEGLGESRSYRLL